MPPLKGLLPGASVLFTVMTLTSTLNCYSDVDCPAEMCCGLDDQGSKSCITNIYLGTDSTCCSRQDCRARECFSDLHCSLGEICEAVSSQSTGRCSLDNAIDISYFIDVGGGSNEIAADYRALLGDLPLDSRGAADYRALFGDMPLDSRGATGSDEIQMTEVIWLGDSEAGDDVVSDENKKVMGTEETKETDTTWFDETTSYNVFGQHRMGKTEKTLSDDSLLDNQDNSIKVTKTAEINKYDNVRDRGLADTELSDSNFLLEMLKISSLTEIDVPEVAIVNSLEDSFISDGNYEQNNIKRDVNNRGFFGGNSGFGSGKDDSNFVQVNNDVSSVMDMAIMGDDMFRDANNTHSPERDLDGNGSQGKHNITKRQVDSSDNDEDEFLSDQGSGSNSNEGSGSEPADDIAPGFSDMER